MSEHDLVGQTTTSPSAELRPYRTVWEAMNTHSNVAAVELRTKPGLAEAVDQLLMGVARFARFHRVDPAQVKAEIEVHDGAITVRLS